MNEPAVFELFARRLPPNRDWLLAAGPRPHAASWSRAALRAARARLPALAGAVRRRVPRLPRRLPLLGRRRGDAGGHRLLRQRAAGPGHGAADRGPAPGDAAPEPDQLPDDGRHQGGPAWCSPPAAASRAPASAWSTSRRGATTAIDAAMKVARSAAVAGCGGTSNVAAAMRYGLRPVGTMAHSYVLSFDDARRRRSAPSSRTSRRRRDAGRHLRHAARACGTRSPRPADDRSRRWPASGSTRATCWSSRERRGGCSTRRG